MGATVPLAVGRLASVLDRPAPSMSRGLSAAHHRRWAAYATSLVAQGGILSAFKAQSSGFCPLSRGLLRGSWVINKLRGYIVSMRTNYRGHTNDLEIWCFPKNGHTFLGVPIIRIFCGLY